MKWTKLKWACPPHPPPQTLCSISGNGTTDDLSYDGDIYLPKPTPAFVPALPFPTSSTPTAFPMISSMCLPQCSQCPLSCLSSAQLSMALVGMYKFPDFHDPAQDLSNLIQPSPHRYLDPNHTLQLLEDTTILFTSCLCTCLPEMLSSIWQIAMFQDELKNHLWWKPSLKSPGSHPELHVPSSGIPKLNDHRI